MKKDILTITRKLLHFILYAACGMAGIAMVICLAYLDIQVHGDITEESYTEMVQESLLFISSWIFFYLARRKKAPGLYLVAGFLMCMFIREWDSVFDQIFHGAWKYIAIPAAIAYSYTALKQGKQRVLSNLAEFMDHGAFDIMSLGMVITLVVSRILGMKLVAMLLAGPNYNRVFKNFLEEGFELYGYYFIFVASLLYLYSALQEEQAELVMCVESQAG